MQAFHSFTRKNSLINNAHDILYLFSRPSQRQSISSTRRAISSPSGTAQFLASCRSSKQPVTLNSFRSPLFRRTPRHQQSRLNSTKNSPVQEPPKSKSTSPDPTPNLNSPPGSENLSLSQRLRKLSREYGWSALGVYLALSALDFPFCFAAVRMLGVERIGRWEHIIVNGVKDVITYPFPEGTFGSFGTSNVEDQEVQPVIVAAVPAQRSQEVAQPGDSTQEWSWGVEEADHANSQGATIWTQLALAYAIHKSFIFLRVPLTAAVTPKVVKVLRGWGWNIGKRRPKPQT